MHNIKKINHNTKLSLTLGVLAGVIALIHYFIYELSILYVSIFFIILVVIFHIVVFHIILKLWSKYIRRKKK